MERYLRPNPQESDSSHSTVAKEWLHWIRTFQAFTQAVQQTAPTVNKLDLLVNYIAPPVFDYIAECPTYDAAEATLQALYVKPKKKKDGRVGLTVKNALNWKLEEICSGNKLEREDILAMRCEKVQANECIILVVCYMTTMGPLAQEKNVKKYTTKQTNNTNVYFQ
ncbi:hypothetical protein FHG87_008971 [Trinorchestia longiramus]|nr:hypothetical protein FHG87_008971 [Trinorchestia longiramus]